MSHLYYKPANPRLHRSELAVPGSSPKMFEKALNSNADYIFLDLEDAVSPNDKINARANVIKALNEINTLTTNCEALCEEYFSERPQWLQKLFIKQ